MWRPWPFLSFRQNRILLLYLQNCVVLVSEQSFDNCVEMKYNQFNEIQHSSKTSNKKICSTKYVHLKTKSILLSFWMNFSITRS